MERRSLTRDIAGVLGTRGVWMLMGMLTGVILARQLGPHDRGLLALVLLLPSTVVTLGKLGITQSNVYFINRQEAPIEKIASNAVVLSAAIGLFAAGIVWLFRDLLLSSVLRGLASWAVAAALVRVPLLLLDDYLYGVLQAVGGFRLYNKRLIIGEVLRLTLVAAALLVFKFRLMAAVLIYSGLTIVMVTWLALRVREQVRFRFRLDRRWLPGQLRFGLKSYVQTLTSHLLLRVDIYMVAFYLTPEATAFYALAVRFTELVLEIPQAVGLVLYPRLAAVRVEEIHRLTAQACRRTLLLTGAAALGVAVAGPFVVTLWYGQPYAPAGAPLPWTAFGVMMISIFVIVTRAFTSQGRQQVNIGAGLLALGSNVALNIYLIPRLGIVGAAMATAVSYTAACVVLLLFYCIESHLSPAEVLLPQREDFRFLWNFLRRALTRAGFKGWPR